MFLKLIRSRRPVRVRLGPGRWTVTVLDERGEPALNEDKTPILWSPGRMTTIALMEAKDKYPKATEFDVFGAYYPDQKPHYRVRVEPVLPGGKKQVLEMYKGVPFSAA